MTFRLLQSCTLGALALAGSLVVPSATFAQYSGNNFHGDFGVNSGSQAGPGFYLAIPFGQWNADSLKNVDGDDVAAAFQGFDRRAMFPTLIVVTPRKVLGANYGFHRDAFEQEGPGSEGRQSAHARRRCGLQRAEDRRRVWPNRTFRVGAAMTLPTSPSAWGCSELTFERSAVPCLDATSPGSDVVPNGARLPVHVVGGNRSVRPLPDDEQGVVIVDQNQGPFPCRRLVAARDHLADVIELTEELRIEA